MAAAVAEPALRKTGRCECGYVYAEGEGSEAEGPGEWGVGGAGRSPSFMVMHTLGRSRGVG